MACRQATGCVESLWWGGGGGGGGREGGAGGEVWSRVEEALPIYIVGVYYRERKGVETLGGHWIQTKKNNRKTP